MGKERTVVSALWVAPDGCLQSLQNDCPDCVDLEIGLPFLANRSPSSHLTFQSFTCPALHAKVVTGNYSTHSMAPFVHAS